MNLSKSNKNAIFYLNFCDGNDLIAVIDEIFEKDTKIKNRFF